METISNFFASSLPFSENTILYSADLPNIIIGLNMTQYTATASKRKSESYYCSNKK